MTHRAFVTAALVLGLCAAARPALADKCDEDSEENKEKRRARTST